MYKFIFSLIIGSFFIVTSYASSFLNKIYIAHIEYNGETQEIHYRATYNKHGAILTNKKNERLYLGVKCDAYSPKYGSGSWMQNNGGFVVEFKNISIPFGRQEMTMPQKISC